MSFAITLPETVLSGDQLKVAKDYAKEVALVAIILSDNWMKPLYEKQDIGYIACLDVLHEWAEQFVSMFAHVDDWEEFLETDTRYGKCLCWDEFVIAYGEYKLKNHA